MIAAEGRDFGDAPPPSAHEPGLPLPPDGAERPGAVPEPLRAPENRRSDGGGDHRADEDEARQNPDGALIGREPA